MKQTTNKSFDFKSNMKRIGKLLSVLLAVSLIVCTAVLTLSATAALSATISGYKVTRTGSQEAVDFTPDTVLHRGDSFEALVTVQSNLSSGTTAFCHIKL